MLLIFASAFLISTAHAATRPRVEVSFVHYARELVEYPGEQPGYYWDYHAVGLPLTIDLEIGRTIQRRFEIERYRGIDDGWYIRTNLQGG